MADAQLVVGRDEGDGEASDEVARDLGTEREAVLVAERHGLLNEWSAIQKFVFQFCART